MQRGGEPVEMYFEKYILPTLELHASRGFENGLQTSHRMDGPGENDRCGRRWRKHLDTVSVMFWGRGLLQIEQYRWFLGGGGFINGEVRLNQRWKQD